MSSTKSLWAFSVKFSLEPGDFSEPAESVDRDLAGRGAFGLALAVEADAGLAPEIWECLALSRSEFALKREVPGVPLALAWGVPAAVKTAGPSGAGRRSSSKVLLRITGLGLETRGAEPPQGIGLL